MTESTDRLDSTKLNSVESASTNIADNKVPIAVSSTHQSIDSKTMNHTPKAMYVTSGNSITPKGKLNKMPKMVANGSRAFIWYLLANKQLGRIARNPSFMADYNHLVSST
ncbi:MAG: hypothetical protein V7622_13855, partial [Psychrobacter sp.]